MDNRIWSAEEEAIIATNTEATECKRCAVELGYWKDDYIGYFAKHVDRKAPEINRGYYARVKGVEMFIHQFLERCDTKCQIINLGCGFDTLYWRLKDTTQAVGNFIELDFPAVTAKKAHIIKRNKALLEKICNEDGEVVIREGDLHSDGYHLVGCDLRCLTDVKRKLSVAAAGAPTLVLAECVLVYLRSDAADALLRHLAAAFPRCVLLTYEQCSLDDKFGEVMARNLRGRGVAAPGRSHALGPADGAARLQTLGWGRARAWDMVAVWRALPDEDRARVERLEMLDERELLTQLNSHYALAVATTCDLFADMDLNA
ncbi:leucine carboxyl methyltransferase 1 [Bombyx mandarina]|uniref:Leucine carboxyl methyltransferase 1 n=2 Tax=Bombyx TaxID=7090 RepID=A0A8R2DMN2_BOMMO|nr:leucine carboxyl methyltransferase 1 [Bombyx mori]XP_028027560.1 leucine carboxyl methyltransferase 1 [Bombyx mandarina]